MNKRINSLLGIVIISVMVPYAHAQTSFDLEDIDLQTNADFIDDFDKTVCGITELKNNVFLPFTLTANYPDNQNVQVLATSNNPEESDLKRIQNPNFFTLSSRNSTDTFTIKATWEYGSKPNEPRPISWELFSDDVQVHVGNWKFDAFKTCYIWIIETDVAEHIPTLEEFQEQNDIQINDAFEVVAEALIDGNDLLLIVILVGIGVAFVVAVLVGIIILSNRANSMRAEESEVRLNEAVKKVTNIISGLKILSRNEYTEHSEMRDSYLRVFSTGSSLLSNLILDLRTILQNMIKDNPKIIEDVHLKTDALKSSGDRNEVTDFIKSKEPKKNVVTNIKEVLHIKDKPKIDKTSEEYFFEQYQDVKKFPNEKLEEIDSKLRVEYDKHPTYELTNEINAISKVIKQRFNIK